MTKPNDLSRSLAPFEQNACVVAVIELSQSSWLVAGTVPGIERQPLKKLEPDVEGLLRLLHRWRDEATGKGREIRRIAVAYEAGRDGFWLARWLRRYGIDVHVMHPTSVAVSREHRRAKTDRLDAALLLRAFFGWLRGEPGHCRMVAVPTLAEEDAKRPSREHETLAGECTRTINRLKGALARLGIRGFNPKLKSAQGRLEALRTPEGEPIPPNLLHEMNNGLARLAFIRAQMKTTERARLERIKEAPEAGTNPMVLLLAKVVGIGPETADMLVHEVLARGLRDRRAVARFAGLTGSPDGERRAATREGPLEIWQRASAVRDDRARLALPAAPKGQRAGDVVQEPRRSSWRAKEDDDLRSRTETARCAVAPGSHGRGPARRRAAPGSMIRIMGSNQPSRDSVPITRPG